MSTDQDNAIQTTTKSPAPLLEALFQVGAHVGHSKSRHHPKMDRFVFAVRNNIEVFDLEQTALLLEQSEGFCADLGKEGRLVLWVGTKPAARGHIERVAQNLEAPYVSERWLGGLLTNFKELSKRLEYWKRLEAEAKNDELEKYVKKEKLIKLNELRKLTRVFSGLRTLKSLPDAIVIIDPKDEHTAFEEAKKKNIPIVAVLNSDCDPLGIRYPIPANDNSASVIKFIVERLAAAYRKGRDERAASIALDSAERTTTVAEVPQTV